MQNKKKVIVIGAGFAGLSSACYLAKAGFDVTVLEKNKQAGGRARSFTEQGFTFDMGPSWYWMPDVFESFFQDFGKKTSDYYELLRLSPSYKVIFGDKDAMDVPADIHQLLALFESIEKGSSQKLQQFLSEAQYKYEVGMQDLVQKPGHNLLEFADRRVIKGVFKLHLLESFHNYVRKYFSHPKLIQLLEFPVLFLGAEPKNIPALYSLMNYADMQLGTWYPEGGMYKIVEAMANLANELGVKIRLNETVNEIICEEKNIKKIISSHGIYLADYVVGGADYHHIEQHLLPIQYRQYSEEYWNSRVLAPSSLLYYIGLDTTLDNLEHHNLFFDADFNKHSEEIYKNPAWPSDPLFYVSVTSKTDNTVAPFGCENIFILIPTATDMPESKSIQEHYFTIVMNRLEKHVGKNIREHIIFRRDYAHSNFVADYNSYKGNAYGLANTLMQTAILKPKLKSKKLNNLYYTGQLTVPGPGVPPSLISGKIVANEIIKKNHHMATKSLFDTISFETSKLTTVKYSTSFSSAIKVLNKRFHEPIYNIYGFVRFADEIVDTFHDFDKQSLFIQFEQDTYRAIGQKISLNPILNSFQKTVRTYNIHHDLIATFLKSMKMDLDKNTYSKDEYDEYIVGSAEVVGLMCLKVFCEGDEVLYEKLKPAAMRLGAAFQKINFLRDLCEDCTELNRVYFPNLNIDQFNQESKKEIERDIELDFKAGFEGVLQLPKSTRFGVYLAYIYYKSLFKKIINTKAERIMYDRIRIPDSQKLILLFNSYLRHNLNLL